MEGLEPANWGQSNLTSMHPRLQGHEDIKVINGISKPFNGCDHCGRFAGIPKDKDKNALHPGLQSLAA